MNFVKALYKNVKVHVNYNGIMHFAFLASSGVLTGCPLSASLFVLALNPFLLDFHRVILAKSFGVLYACADDLGRSLLKIASLIDMHRICSVVGCVAGLFLNPAKCVLTPLVAPNSNFFNKFSKWLSKYSQEWEIDLLLQFCRRNFIFSIFAWFFKAKYSPKICRS